MRGSHRSRQPMDILQEARALVGEGVKELNLISQDSTYYGLDLRPQASRAIASPERFRAAVDSLRGDGPTLASLVRQTNALPGDFWIRLLYTHPAHWTEELIQAIAESPKVARYIDIPLQHIHENMLERMRRETSRRYIEELLERLREGIPGVALRTTFIVGFPGETEEYFASLLEFIRKVKFERLGVFTYSQEEGTRAGKMAGQIPEEIRRERRDRAMAVQREVAREVSQRFVGRTLRVLVEKQAGPNEMKAATVESWEHGQLRGGHDGERKLSGKWYVARGEADAPDIDGRVYVHGACVPGEFAQVKITGHTDYDLLAEIDF
jgi:ribosomal protein S12 methylthiotransferase